MQKKWLNAAFIVLLVFVAFYLYRKYRVAPEIDLDHLPLSTIDGVPVKLSAFEGKKVILCFGASWCGNCLEELHDLKQVAHLLPADVEVVVISDEQPQRIESLIKKGFPFTFLKLNKSFGELGINAIPTSYLLNRNLKVKKETVGYLNWKDESTRQHLLKLLES